MWTIAYESKAIFSVPYPLLVFPTLLLMDLKYQTLRICMWTCSVCLLLSLLVTFLLDLCIYWVVLRGMLLLKAPPLYILTVQLFQNVLFFHIYAVNQVLRTFLMIVCWSCCLHGSQLSQNLLCHILFYFLKCFGERYCSLWCEWFYQEKLIFPVLLWNNIKPRMFKCPCIDVEFCVALILEDVKENFDFWMHFCVFLLIFPCILVVAPPCVWSDLFMSSIIMLQLRIMLLLT